MPMDGNDVLLLLSLHTANPCACLHPSPQTLGWGGTSTTFTRGLTFGLTSIRMDTAGGGADDLLGRAALPLKVGHPADHCVILRGRQVISLCLSVSLSVSLYVPVFLSISLSRQTIASLRGRQAIPSVFPSVHLRYARTHARTILPPFSSLTRSCAVSGPRGARLQRKVPLSSHPVSTTALHPKPQAIIPYPKPSPLSPRHQLYPEAPLSAHLAGTWLVAFFLHTSSGRTYPAWVYSAISGANSHASWLL